METKIDLNDPETRTKYRALYQKRYRETVGEPETVRKDKADAYAFTKLWKQANANA